MTSGILFFDEVSVDFGLRIDAEAGTVIAKTGVSGHFTVSLHWSRAQPVPPSLRQ